MPTPAVNIVQQNRTDVEVISLGLKNPSKNALNEFNNLTMGSALSIFVLILTMK